MKKRTITDAERMQWLTKYAYRLAKIAMDVTDVWCVEWHKPNGEVEWLEGRDPRAAIDSAIRAEKKKARKS